MDRCYFDCRWKWRLIVIFAVFLVVSCSEKDNSFIDDKDNDKITVTIMPLSKAYAKNSINTSVFRTNSICSDRNYQFVSYFDSEGFVTFARRQMNSFEWEIVKTDLSVIAQMRIMVFL